jgi:hypothetical protein
MVGFIFSKFFNSPMEVSQVGDCLLNHFSIKLQVNPQHPVSAGVLGTHVQNHGFRAQVWV